MNLPYAQERFTLLYIQHIYLSMKLKQETFQMVTMSSKIVRSTKPMSIDKSYHSRIVKQKRLQKVKLKRYCSKKENCKDLDDTPSTAYLPKSKTESTQDNVEERNDRNTDGNKESSRRELLRRMSTTSEHGGIPPSLSRCYRRCSTVSVHAEVSRSQWAQVRLNNIYLKLPVV